MAMTNDHSSRNSSGQNRKVVRGLKYSASTPQSLPAVPNESNYRRGVLEGRVEDMEALAVVRLMDAGCVITEEDSLCGDWGVPPTRVRLTWSLTRDKRGAVDIDFHFRLAAE